MFTLSSIMYDVLTNSARVLYELFLFIITHRLRMNLGIFLRTFNTVENGNCELRMIYYVGEGLLYDSLNCNKIELSAYDFIILY